MVETRVEILAPVEEPPREPVATALSCWLRAASWDACCLSAAEELIERAEPAPWVVVLPVPALDALDSTKAPPAPAVAWVPLTAPPEVEIKMSRKVSGLCQKAGATSITT